MQGTPMIGVCLRRATGWRRSTGGKSDRARHRRDGGQEVELTNDGEARPRSAFMPRRFAASSGLVKTPPPLPRAARRFAQNGPEDATRQPAIASHVEASQLHSEVQRR